MKTVSEIEVEGGKDSLLMLGSGEVIYMTDSFLGFLS